MCIKSIKIDNVDGPYQQQINADASQHCLDVTYHYYRDGNDDQVVAMPVKHLLDENIGELHDIILKEQTNWSVDWKRWWRMNSEILPILFRVHDIIYDPRDQIYLAIRDIATAQYRTCYKKNYYRDRLCLYGGFKVDISETTRANKIVLDKKERIYCSNICEIVSHHRGALKQLVNVMKHNQLCGIKQIVLLNCRVIQSYHLRFNSYGKHHELQIKIPCQLFLGLIEDELKTKDIFYRKTSKCIDWRLSHEEADEFWNYGKDPFFHKYHGVDIVYVHDIHFQYFMQSNSLNIDYYVLQKDSTQTEPIVHGWDVVEQNQLQ